MKKNQFPYPCQECEQAAPDQFTVYEPLGDWVMLDVPKKLIHIHFGESSHDDKSNLEEATFQWEWAKKTTEKHPKTKFFWIIDMSRKDDSEILTKEARDQYQKIRTHPQLPAGAAYGYTWAMRMIMSLLNVMGGQATLVDTEQDARAVYQAWLKENK